MRPERVRRFAIACIAAASVVLIDQVSKAAARGELSQDERILLLGDLLGLQLAFNPGAILSLGAGATGLLTVLSILAVALLTVAAARSRSGWWAAGIGLILGGAIGNLIDRLFSPPGFGIGHVTDFLAYGNLFIGNIADIALGAGVIVLAGAMWARRRITPTTRQPSTGAAVGES
ncbi:signal peptidase II [Microbacterium yannicii]|uniref:signal peptidase II n=1 Tax=Microbacterium yannicii TaxID=671622 RepID=UPI0005906E74|nr:signal peptidase II [Microbacterium yannicii]